MVIRKDEMQQEFRQGLRGGDGEVTFLHLMESGSVPHARLFAELTLDPGSSIGEHEHTGETEYYWILSGSGIVTEADGEKPVSAGDLVVTGGGASHAIRNTGEV
ncbi:MAG TPA: cupin domain-containing protein, partial [Sphaerochaeta sp.]|nr:cupin domain-containing protein [Sphaerochaeta sp.]